MALQVWLPLNGNIENQGLSDISVNNVGATVSSAGKIGQCYYFNGSSQYLQFNKSLPNLYCGDFSWALWVKPTDDSRGILISEYSSAGSSNVALELLANRQIRVYWDASPDWSTGVYINSNVWSHIAVTKSENLLKVYVNGELKVTGNYTLSDKTSSSKIRIGDDYRGGTTVSYQGYLNDVRIYNHCLSLKEIKEISKGLVLHYKMDGCTMDARNLLENSNLYTVVNKLSQSTTNTDGYFPLPKLYYNDDAMGGKTVTFSVCTDKPISSAHTGHDVVTLWFYLKTSAYDGTNSSYTTPVNLTSSGASFKSLGNNRYSWTYTVPSGTKGLMIRTNLYSNNGSTVSANFWNFQLELGDKASPFVPKGSASTTVYDCSGFGYNGTITSTTAPILDSDSPRYNSCFNFDTTGKYITCPAIDFSGMTASYSFAWWGKTPSWDVGLMYWGFSNGNRLNYYSGYYWNTGDGSNNPFYSSGTTTITRPSVNVWHHYVVTGNGSATKLYVDGTLYGTAKTNRNITGTQIYIHGWDSSASYKNAGDRISDFRIYATPLSAEDVKELYNTSAMICDNGTVMAYSLEE